jgi:hypothetical protein
MSRFLRSVGGQGGQATVELVGLLPLAFAVATAVFCVLAAGRARELAAHAAGAGAVALLQDGDPQAAARRAIGARRESVQVSVRDRVVTVEVRPRLPVPALSSALSATRSADAGPEARP